MNQLLIGGDFIRIAKFLLNATGIDCQGNPRKPYLLIWNRMKKQWDELQLWQTVKGLPCIQIDMLNMANNVIRNDFLKPEMKTPINIAVEGEGRKGLE
eukprot:4814524-Karenia_brevis.AAC.1